MNGGTHAGNWNTFGNTVVSLLRCKELCFDLPITIHMQGASLFLSQCMVYHHNVVPWWFISWNAVLIALVVLHGAPSYRKMNSLPIIPQHTSLPCDRIVPSPFEAAQILKEHSTPHSNHPNIMLHKNLWQSRGNYNHPSPNNHAVHCLEPSPVLTTKNFEISNNLTPISTHLVPSFHVLVLTKLEH